MSRILIVVSVLIGLILAAVIGLMVVLDNPDAYKKRLSAAFESQTGYGLEINGTIDWQYFPPIAIALTDVAVTTPRSEEPLASVDAASVGLKVLPLIFGGSVEVSEIQIDGFTVNAEVDRNGVGNWETDVAGSTESEAPTDTADTSSGGNSLTIDIGGIRITDASVTYINKAANSHYVLQIPQFRTGALGTGITTNINGTILLEDKISELSADIGLKGKAAINKTLDEFTLDNFEVTSTVRQPETSTITSTLTLNGLVNTTTAVASLNNSELALSDLRLAFGVEAQDIFSTPQIEGSIKAPAFNLREVLVALDADPGPTANPKAMSKVSLDANIKGTPERMALTKLNLSLDQSQLNGSATISLADKTGIAFDLTVNEITVSDYLAPTSTETTTTADGKTTTTVTDSEVLPVETLREINVDGKFSIGKLQYEDWAATDIQLTINNRQQQLKVDSGLKAYSGTANFNLASNYSGATPSTTSGFSVTGVDITQALELEALTGTLELNANHTFNGSMMSQLVNSLNGKSTYNIADGTLNVQPIKRIAAIVDGLQGTQSGIAQWPDMLPFKFLQGDHNFNQGITSGQTLNASIENMRITGTGGIDYFANTLAYDLNATLLDSAGQFKVNPKLTGIKFPLRCKGSLNDTPADLCLPDRSEVTKLIRDMAAQEVKRQGSEAIKKKIEEQVPDELKDAAKGLLKGLFNK